MNCFEILGIEPTENERDIKKAYAALLKIYHPEEQPEKFKEIYDAYISAIQFAKFTKNKVIEDNQDIEVCDSLNKHSNQEDVLKKTIDLEKNYKQFIEKSQKDTVTKIYEIENQTELRELYELHQKEFNEQDTKYEELENKFEFVTDYEKKYVEKEKEIKMLLAKLDRRPREFDYLIRNVFNSIEFQKYCNDPLFIKEYIEMIDDGFYDLISMSDKKLFKNFHEKVFFSTSEAREKNKRLYESLYPFLFKLPDKKRVLENVIFITLMPITLMFGIANNIIYGALVIELMTYLLLCAMKSVKYRYVNVFRKLTIIIFSICVSFSLICCFYVPSKSFGDYVTKTYNVRNQILKQTSQGFIYGIENHEGDVYIKTSNKSYKIDYLGSNLQDFGLYQDNLYYISENNVFISDKEKPIMSTNEKIYRREITSNEDICLLMEETINGIVNVYQLKNSTAIKIHSYNGLLETLSGCKEYYLDRENLYYGSRETDFLMCYDIKNSKVEVTEYSLVGVYSIAGIEDNLLFCGDNPYLKYNSYIFKEKVIRFVNLDNRKFAYINELGMLYIVDSITEEEIAAVDLGKDYGIDGYDINSIAGNGTSVALIYKGCNRLEIHLK